MFLLAIKLSSQNDTINRSFEEAGKSKVLMEKVKIQDVQIPDDRDIKEEKVTIDTVNNKYKNSIELSYPFTYIQVPFKGFFRNNRLFNASMQGIQISYFRSLKKYPNWSLGLMFGYEEYKVRFYDVVKDNPDDTNFIRRKYQNALYFQDLLSGTPINFNFHDSLLYFYGERIYPFKLFRMGYSIRYTKKLNDKWTILYTFETSGTISYIGKIVAGNFIKFDEEYKRGGNSVSINSNSSILTYFPFVYQIYHLYQRTNWHADEVDGLGMIKNQVGVDYKIYKNHSLWGQLSLANLLPLNYKKDGVDKPTYSVSKNHPLCLSCTPPSYPYGIFHLPFSPNLYFTAQLYLGYRLKF